MTTIEEFISFLDKRPNYEYELTQNLQGEPAILIYQTIFRTETLIDISILPRYDCHSLITFAHQGKNVEHVTRVTGFFSKVSGWNKGKRGELQDRYRSTV